MKELIVQIKRKPDTTRRPKEMVDNGRQSIGACTVSPNSTAPLTGLDAKEIRLLLPHLLAMSPEDVQFMQKVQNFYYDSADIDVPPVVGASFVVNLQDDTKKLGEKLDEFGNVNMPVNIADYVMYRKAIADPSVAPSFDKLGERAEYKYYVHNPVKEFKKEVDLAEKRDEAMQAWFKIKGKTEHYDPILRLYGFDPERDYDNVMQKERDLRRIAAAELKVPGSGKLAPEKQEAFDVFIARVGDPLLKEKALIQEMVDNKIVRKSGNSYIFGSVTMGKTLDEAAEWWQTDEASDDVATMKGKLDSTKKKVN